jgi:Domain of unknown function (DUF5615)
MILWIDAQLSAALAPWITQQFGIDAYSLKRLGYRDATDPVIFQAAREAGAVVMTKDSDFLRLLEQYGPPPQVSMGDARQYLERPLRHRQTKGAETDRPSLRSRDTCPLLYPLLPRKT